MLKKILTYFRNLETKKEENLEELNGAYFHEDLFRQVEFIPRENINFIESENKKIDQFSKDNFDGNGFTDIYVREESENQITIIEKKINLVEIDKFLIDLGMEKIENVYYLYGSKKIKCETTIAFKYKRAQIYLVYENEIVKDLFIDGFRFHKNEEDKEKLKIILNKIGMKFNLILNDWDLTEIIDLKNQNEIEKYLNEEL
jgi:hypothetical protein